MASRMTIYNWKTNNTVPRFIALKNAYDNGVDVSDFIDKAISFHKSEITKLKSLKGKNKLSISKSSQKSA